MGIICVFYIIIASLLIHGARTGRPSLLTPWIVLTAISMVLQVFNVVAGLVALEWGKAFSTVIGLVIEGYFFVCVWSFRSSCRVERLRRHPRPEYKAIRLYYGDNNTNQSWYTCSAAYW